MILGPIITTQVGSLQELQLSFASATMTGPDSAIIVSSDTRGGTAWAP